MAMDKDILGSAIADAVEAWRSSEGYRALTSAERIAVEDLWTRIAGAIVDHLTNNVEQKGQTQINDGHRHYHDGPSAGIK